MKLHYRLLSLFLSFSIFILFFLQCNLFVYASDELDITDLFPDANKTIYDYGTDEYIFGGRNWDDLTVNDKIGFSVFYALSQAKVFVSGDFSSFLNNHTAFSDYRNSIENDDGKYVYVNQGAQTITFSEDFIAAMKQALIEYAEETNGFTLMPTTNINYFSASDFKSSYVYHSFRNLVYENGLVAVTGGGVSGNMLNKDLNFSIFLPFDKDSIKNTSLTGSVSLVNAADYTSPYWEKVWFYDSLSWEWLNYTVYDCNVYYNTEEGHTAYKVVTSFDECSVKTSGVKSDFTNVGYSYIGWNPLLNFSKNYSGYFLYSTDGRKLKVFNSLNALKNYVVGDRSVYFGSGFYDTPGEITVSFDDLEKYIDGKYDDFFSDLKDLIGQKTDNEDSLTEEDLEKLVDKILDGINNDGSGDDNKGDNDNSGLLGSISDALDGITSTISGYLDAILAYLQSILTDLDYIVMELQELPEEQAKEKTDSVLSELKGSFSEVGDMMTKKFPFCIPWDLKQLYVSLNGGKEYSPESPAMLSDGGSPPVVSGSSPYTGSGNLVDVIVYSSPASRASPASDTGIMMLADNNSESTDISGVDAGVYPSASGAPVFHIPFVIKSVGINSALVIDMSPFDGVSDISRTLFLLLFLYQLILLSIRITEFLEGFIG